MGLADPVADQDCDQAPVVVPCGLPDGFHVAPWTQLDLAGLESAWLALAEQAATPNPFFEHWYLIPALEAFDPQGRVMLAMLAKDGRLVGLAPHHSSPTHHGRALPNCGVWLHHNAFLGSPLVAAGHEESFWTAYLAWCDSEVGKSLFLHLPQQLACDSLESALRIVCRRQRRRLRPVMRQKRAMLSSPLGAQAYREAAMPNKKRKELRRQYNRLGEAGSLAMVRTRDADGVERWIDDFLALEARGWKGEGGSALSSSPQTESLFRSAIASAAQLGRLERLMLTLDNRPIAMLATFLAGRGAFSFKTAYDEDLARFSPGVQLQLANLDLLDDPDIDWCDSCAAQDHAMIDHIWRERREISWYSIPIGRGTHRWLGEVWTTLESWRWSRTT